MPDPWVLAFDVGTTNVKAVLADLNGQVVGDYAVGYPLRRLGAGLVEQDLSDIERAMSEATGNLLARTAASAGQLQAIATTGQMFNVVPVGPGVTLCNPMLSWLDQRASGEATEFERQMPVDEQFEVFDAVLTAKDMVPRIKWFERYGLDTETAVESYLDCKDAVVLGLTGNAVTDPTGASAYRLYDADTGTWDPRRCSAASVRIETLPEVRSAFAAAGELLPSAAERLGLEPGLPVAVGAGDVATSQLGSGAVRPGDIHLSLGTSSYFGIVLDRHLLDPGRRLGPLAHVTKDHWILWLEIATAGGALAWLGRAMNGGSPATPHRFTAEEVVAASDGMDSLLFAPWLSGERVPVFDDDVRGAFVGLGLHHDGTHLARAVMEGVAYQIRWAFEYGLAYGVTPGDIRVVGGGASGRAWLHIIADVLRRPLHVVNAPEHTAARASALIAAAMLSGQQDIVTPVSLDQSVEPDSSTTGRHDENFARFRTLYELLKSLDAPRSEPPRPSEKAAMS